MTSLNKWNIIRINSSQIKYKTVHVRYLINWICFIRSHSRLCPLHALTRLHSDTLSWLDSILQQLRSERSCYALSRLKINGWYKMTLIYAYTKNYHGLSLCCQAKPKFIKVNVFRLVSYCDTIRQSLLSLRVYIFHITAMTSHRSILCQNSTFGQLLSWYDNFIFGYLPNNYIIIFSNKRFSAIQCIYFYPTTFFCYPFPGRN